MGFYSKIMRFWMYLWSLKSSNTSVNSKADDLLKEVNRLLGDNKDKKTQTLSKVTKRIKTASNLSTKIDAWGMLIERNDTPWFDSQDPKKNKKHTLSLHSKYRGVKLKFMDALKLLETEQSESIRQHLVSLDVSFDLSKTKEAIHSYEVVAKNTIALRTIREIDSRTICKLQEVEHSFRDTYFSCLNNEIEKLLNKWELQRSEIQQNPNNIRLQTEGVRLYQLLKDTFATWHHFISFCSATGPEFSVDVKYKRLKRAFERGITVPFASLDRLDPISNKAVAATQRPSSQAIQGQMISITIRDSLPHYKERIKLSRRRVAQLEAKCNRLQYEDCSLMDMENILSDYENTVNLAVDLEIFQKSSHLSQTLRNPCNEITALFKSHHKACKTLFRDKKSELFSELKQSIKEIEKVSKPQLKRQKAILELYDKLKDTLSVEQRLIKLCDSPAHRKHGAV